MCSISNTAVPFIFLASAFTLASAQDGNVSVGREVRGENKLMAQERRLNDKLDWALETADYPNILSIADKLLAIDPDDPAYNYYAGLSRMHVYEVLDSSVAYWEKTAAATETLPDVFFFLGEAYQEQTEFDKAIAHYNRFLSLITDNPLQSEFNERVKRNIEQCNYGKVMQNTTVEVVIENLGGNVNTDYAEYAPVVAGDESYVIFTSRRRKEGERTAPQYLDEDIYITYIEADNTPSLLDTGTARRQFVNLLNTPRFSPANLMSDNLNTDNHDAAVGLSVDNSKLFIYRGEDIWESEYTGSRWTHPVKTSGPVNSKYYEPSLSFSADEKTAFLVSDRRGGYGGTDIWMLRRDESGGWGRAVNLGPAINTPYDEDSPYVDPDGKTLYFSSKGHSSMGGYDVFKSVFEGGRWTAPQNMGYPVNSGGDDIYFMMLPKRNRGYYSSNRPGGKGDMDLYRLTFAHERAPLAEITGLVMEGERYLPAQSQITVLDRNGEKALATFSSDGVTGKYLVLLPHGKKYTINVATEGFAPYEKVFDIPAQVKYYQYYQEIHHVHLSDKEGNVIGQKISTYNAFFNIDDMVQARKRSAQAESGEGSAEKESADRYEGLRTPLESAEKQYGKQDAEEDRRMETNTLLKDDRAQEYSKLLKEMKITDMKDITEMSEIKYYLPEDTVVALMEQDSVARMSFDTTVEIRFYDPMRSERKMAKHEVAPAERPRYIPSSTPVKEGIYDITAYVGRQEEAGEEDAPPSPPVDDLPPAAEESMPEETAPVRPALPPPVPVHRPVVVTETVSEKLYDKVYQALNTEQKTAQKHIYMLTVYFDYNRDVFSDKFMANLDSIYNIITGLSYSRLEVHVHSDSKGSADFNRMLSMNRGFSVKNYLVSKGLPGALLKIVPHGESQLIYRSPSDDAYDAEKEAVNRRCVIRIIP